MGLLSRIFGGNKTPVAQEPVFRTSREIETDRTKLKKEAGDITRLKEDYLAQKGRRAVYFAISDVLELKALGDTSYWNELPALAELALNEGYLDDALRAYEAMNSAPQDDELKRVIEMEVRQIEKNKGLGKVVVCLDALLKIQTSKSSIRKRTLN